MIVVTSTYLKPHEEMEPLLAEHALWLKAQHEAGHFISSGSNIERTGGAILTQGLGLAALEALLATAPLALAGAIRYELTEMNHSTENLQETA